MSLSSPSKALETAELPAEYVALRKKVDDFAEAVAARRPADLMCRAGCAACCHADLTVSSVEAAAIVAYLKALPAGERDALAEDLRAAAKARKSAPEPPACAMLRSDDTCAIYSARPLVCRSQGLPLLYPAELVPKPAQRGQSADGRALTICPLNFRDAAHPPRREDILDGERVDVLLSMLNRRFTADASSDSRYRLTDLAQEFVE